MVSKKILILLLVLMLAIRPLTTVASAFGGDVATTAPLSSVADIWHDYRLFVIIGGGILVLIVIIVVAACAFKKNKSESATVAQVAVPSLRLRNADIPEQVWDLPLSGEAFIGRSSADCRVALNDASVSRKQCKVAFINGAAVIENVSQSNVTTVNGNQINAPAVLAVGDKIVCGRTVLLVESIA
jgi:hypothetical protein